PFRDDGRLEALGEVMLARRRGEVTRQARLVADLEFLGLSAREFGVACARIAGEVADRLGTAVHDDRGRGGQLLIPEVKLVGTPSALLELTEQGVPLLQHALVALQGAEVCR